MKERGFQTEPQFLRKIRRLSQPNITPESSRKYLDSRTKRALDIIVASAGLPVGFPLTLLAVGVNKVLEPHEEAFYRTERVGKGGKTINLVKIRSMQSADVSETGADEVDSARISLFGKFLRRSAIDELPQIFSILNGDISVVGPRAMPVWELDGLRTKLPPDEFEKWHQAYLSSRPGGSGLRQILGNRELSNHQRIRLDRFYVEHANLGLDLYILFSSPFALIRGKGIR